MALFEWSDDFLTGIDVIDEDHRLLVSLINQLHDAIEADQERDVVGSVLTVLMEYTRTHFAREELLLKKSRYPDLEQHIAKHDKMKRRVEEIHGLFMDEGASTLAMDTLVFLKDWLTQHILGTDLGYRQYVQGITLTPDEEMTILGFADLETDDGDPLARYA